MRDIGAKLAMQLAAWRCKASRALAIASREPGPDSGSAPAAWVGDGPSVPGSATALTPDDTADTPGAGDAAGVPAAPVAPAVVETCSKEAMRVRLKAACEGSSRGAADERKGSVPGCRKLQRHEGIGRRGASQELGGRCLRENAATG